MSSVKFVVSCDDLREDGCSLQLYSYVAYCVKLKWKEWMPKAAQSLGCVV
jgi:hypothetical protein